MADHETRPVPSRPISPLHLPKLKARDTLSQRLTSVFKLSKVYADTIARIVVDPATVRNQLDFPLLQKLPNGYAQYIVADVWSPGIAVSLINPRENERRIYPVAAKSGKVANFLAPLKVEPSENELPVLKISGNSREHVIEVAAQLRNGLRTNSNLRESIAAQGVLEPLTVVLAVISHANGAGDVVVPMSIDGSTRTTLAHELTGTPSEKVIYCGWTTDSEREWRGRIGDILAAQNLPEGKANDDQLSAHRAVSVPARILVGLKPIRGGSACNVRSASRYIVSRIHLDPPDPWPVGSQNDEIADTVLDRLSESLLITADERAYLAGLIPPNQLKSRGFSQHLDVRAAKIVHAIFSPSNSDGFRDAYLSLMDDRQRVSRKARPEIAAEMIMRSFRGTGDAETTVAITGIRSVLQRVLELPEFRTTRWSVPDVELNDLLSKALAEHKKYPGDLGKSGTYRLILGIMGSYWLASTRAMERDTRTSEDMRSPASLIRTMLSGELGIRVLHRAIVDGRDDRPPQQVSEKGQLLVSEGGETLQVNDNWLRKSFAKGEVDSDQEPIDIARPPRDQLHDGFNELRKIVGLLSNRIQSIKEIKENGAGLIQKEGMPPPAEDLSNALNKAAMEIGMWARKYEQDNIDFDNGRTHEEATAEASNGGQD